MRETTTDTTTLERTFKYAALFKTIAVAAEELASLVQQRQETEAEISEAEARFIYHACALLINADHLGFDIPDKLTEFADEYLGT
jgi:hypothetical protein